MRIPNLEYLRPRVWQAASSRSHLQAIRVNVDFGVIKMIGLLIRESEAGNRRD